MPPLKNPATNDGFISKENRMDFTHKSPVKLQVLAHRLLWALKMVTLKVSDFRTEIKFLRLELTRIVKSSRVVCTPVRQRENIERAFMVVITL